MTPAIECGPSAEALDRVRKYIGSHSWKFAKSMPAFPHWYVVRWDRPELDQEFCFFAQFIRDYGYPGNFFRKKLVYFDLDGFKYWTMGDPIHSETSEARANLSRTTFILNRAIHDDNRNRTA